MQLFFVVVPDHHNACRTAAKALGIKISSKLSPDVTHLVICDPMSADGHAPPRQELFYEALLMGKWIVGLKWITDSYADRELRAEDDYEITGIRGHPHEGPRMARLNAMRMQPRLLNNCKIYLYGEYRSAPLCKRIISLL